jgi:N-acetylglucosaminyl-diphospho-decaprenol L-rhamnosyltransferase
MDRTVSPTALLPTSYHPVGSFVPRSRGRLWAAMRANTRTRMSAPPGPRLSVVLVNYLQWQDTAALVRQLRAAPAVRHGAAEVVIVDNHSPWHRLVPRLRRLSGVSLRRWRANRGFARAVNEGARLGRGDWVLLLNPDMTLEPGFLDKVLIRADELTRRDPQAGIIGFRLSNADGSGQMSAGPFPTLAGTLARLILPRTRRKYYLLPGSGARPVDWVTGCCLLVRRSCWDDLGGLDGSFFLYYEDVDLCRRARSRGWSVWYEPSLCAIHHHPLHAREVPAPLRLITRHALLTYAAKHWPAWQFRLLAGIVRLEAWWRGRRAARAGDASGAGLFREMGRVAADLAGGRVRRAGQRLLRVVRRQEEWRAASSLHRNPQPQPG